MKIDGEIANKAERSGVLTKLYSYDRRVEEAGQAVHEQKDPSRRGRVIIQTRKIVSAENGSMDVFKTETVYAQGNRKIEDVVHASVLYEETTITSGFDRPGRNESNGPKRMGSYPSIKVGTAFLPISWDVLVPSFTSEDKKAMMVTMVEVCEYHMKTVRKAREKVTSRHKGNTSMKLEQQLTALLMLKENKDGCVAMTREMRLFTDEDGDPGTQCLFTATCIAVGTVIQSMYEIALSRGFKGPVWPLIGQLDLTQVEDLTSLEIIR